MRREHIRRWMVALAVAGAAVIASGRAPTVQAQAAATRSNDDVLPALLEEVRGLRAAMEQMASAGPRIQLFVSRLQLQEARINGMVRRLDEIRDRLATAQREAQNAQAEASRIEAITPSVNPPITREEIAGMLAHTKTELEQRKAAVARLTGEEAQLTQDITAEQARWTDINQRLDDLERALVKR